MAPAETLFVFIWNQCWLGIMLVLHGMEGMEGLVQKKMLVQFRIVWHINVNSQLCCLPINERSPSDETGLSALILSIQKSSWLPEKGGTAGSRRLIHILYQLLSADIVGHITNVPSFL